MKIAFLGPPGTFSEEALLAAWPHPFDDIHAPTVYDAVMAGHHGEVDRSFVPIENSLEGSVNATLDALAVETRDITIVGEAVHLIRHCLIAGSHVELADIDTVVSHPQANGQCARFLRERLAHAKVLAAPSTSDAVRMVADADGTWAALGTRLAAELYGCEILRAGVEDVADNETRFVWLGRDGDAGDAGWPGPWKTSLVFWGVGSGEPGWLVR